MSNALLSTREAAERSGYSIATIARMAADGRLPIAHRLPGKTGAFLFRPEDVDALTAEAAS